MLLRVTEPHLYLGVITVAFTRTLSPAFSEVNSCAVFSKQRPRNTCTKVTEKAPIQQLLVYNSHVALQYIYYHIIIQLIGTIYDDTKAYNKIQITELHIVMIQY